MKTIRHLKCTKEINYNKQFITKWNEQYRKSIGVYEPILNISKLFKLSVKGLFLKYNQIKGVK